MEETEEQHEQVLCVLSYAASNAEDYRSRTITVDARTGEVESVYSYAPRLEEDEKPALTLAEARERAEGFLADFAGERWGAWPSTRAGTTPRTAGPAHTFTYVQNANAIPFPENFYTIAIDVTDGSVYSLSYRYDEDVTFRARRGSWTSARPTPPGGHL